MKIFDEFLKRHFPPHRPLPAGIYHSHSSAHAKVPYRLHLRIEPSGEGVLILNAKTVLHLNRTATEYAYHLIKKTSEKEAIGSIANRYNVSMEQAEQDYHDFTGRLNNLVKTIDLDPVTYLDFDRIAPYSKKLLAPYRLDCALTYRVSSKASLKTAPLERVQRELTTNEWKSILQKAWQAGIPHVIFTGGEPTQREDLPEIIAEAEKLGQVSGLLSDGIKLIEKNYRTTLLHTGLDHIMLLLNNDDKKSWLALEKLIAEDIFITVHLTISNKNVKSIESVFDRLAKMGLKSLSLTIADKKLMRVFKMLQDKAAQLQLSLVWDIPVPYSDFHPIAVEMQEKNDKLIDGAGKAWLYVEPDGDVLPEQGINKVMGNLLTDQWESIWSKFK